MKWSLFGVAGLSAMLLATPANASPGERLRPAASPNAHATTESSQVVPAWTPAATILVTYGRLRPSSAKIGLDHRVTTHLLAALGIAGWAEVSLDLPAAIYQRGTGYDGETINASAQALGDLRVGLKGTILRTPRRGWGLGLGLDMTAPTGDPSALMGWGAVTFAPQVLVDLRLPLGMLWSTNVGYWERPELRQADEVLGDVITLRSALRMPVSMSEQFAFVVEADAAFGLAEGARHPVTLRGGIRGRLRSGMVIGLLGGGAPVQAVGVAGAQVLLSVGFAPPKRLRTEPAFERTPPANAYAWARRELQWESPKATTPTEGDLDGDGVLDVADACPHVAEDLDAVDDDDGCPDLDNDADGLWDDIDLCPLAPEVVNGYLDRDGCPDRRLAEGGGQTFKRFEPRVMLPTLHFTGDEVQLSEQAHKQLADLAELLRLNPWIESITITAYVPRHEQPGQERAWAIARAQAVAEALRTHEIDPTRLHIAEPRALPTGVPARVRLTAKIPVLRASEAGVNETTPPVHVDPAPTDDPSRPKDAVNPDDTSR